MKVVLLFVLFLGWHPVTGHLRRSSIPEQTTDVASKEEVPQQPTKRRLGSGTQQLLSAFQFAKAIMLEKLKEDLKTRQQYYLAEAEARLAYQKTMAQIVGAIQDKCRDAQLVEDVVIMALECEAEAKSERAALEAATSKSKSGSSSKSSAQSAPSMADTADSDSDSD